jgi:hypothetical protein
MVFLPLSGEPFSGPFDQINPYLVFLLPIMEILALKWEGLCAPGQAFKNPGRSGLMSAGAEKQTKYVTRARVTGLIM